MSIKFNGKTIASPARYADDIVSSKNTWSSSKIKTEIEDSKVSVFTLKGSVDTVDDLPVTGNLKGDVFIVKSNNRQYAWVGDKWEILGSSALEAIAHPFNEEQSYAVGDYVNYNESLYRCIVNIPIGHAFDPDDWEHAIALDALTGGDLSHVTDAYSETQVYHEGDYVDYSGHLYKCIEDINTPEEWNPAHWRSTKVLNEISIDKFFRLVGKDLYITRTGMTNYSITYDQFNKTATIEEI